MDITELLHRVHSGDREALDAVIPLVYTELKKLASGHLRREGQAPLIETTALVHEAFSGWPARVNQPMKPRAFLWHRVAPDAADPRGYGARPGDSKRSGVREVHLTEIPDSAASRIVFRLR